VRTMSTYANYKPNVTIASDPLNLARQSINIFIQDANKAINTKNVFHVAISGGHTPKLFFKLLGENPRVKSLPWNKIQLFWVDERCVPSDSPASNYKLAADTFLSQVPIPRDNIHRIPTENMNCQISACCYEEVLRDIFKLAQNQLPQFDLIVLGMGKEGHTGSLFPNSYASFDTEDLACVVYAIDKKFNRITLTHPVICAASHVTVLVSGEEKAAILKEVFTNEPDEVLYPIHLLWPILEKVTWVVDKDAAKLL